MADCCKTYPCLLSCQGQAYLKRTPSCNDAPLLTWTNNQSFTASNPGFGGSYTFNLPYGTNTYQIVIMEFVLSVNTAETVGYAAAAALLKNFTVYWPGGQQILTDSEDNFLMLEALSRDQPNVQEIIRLAGGAGLTAGASQAVYIPLFIAPFSLPQDCCSPGLPSRMLNSPLQIGVELNSLASLNADFGWDITSATVVNSATLYVRTGLPNPYVPQPCLDVCSTIYEVLTKYTQSNTNFEAYQFATTSPSFSFSNFQKGRLVGIAFKSVLNTDSLKGVRLQDININYNGDTIVSEPRFLHEVKENYLAKPNWALFDITSSADKDFWYYIPFSEHQLNSCRGICECLGGLTPNGNSILLSFTNPSATASHLQIVYFYNSLFEIKSGVATLNL